jgi:hypothetical protein
MVILVYIALCPKVTRGNGSSPYIGDMDRNTTTVLFVPTLQCQKDGPDGSNELTFRGAHFFRSLSQTMSQYLLVHIIKSFGAKS